MPNPLIEVQKHGQSIWYDYISRALITSGELHALVERDGVLGVTSNPAIFEKAIAGTRDYDPALRALVAQGVRDAEAIYEHMAIQDIQLGADVLHPTYCRSEGRDGYVSLEVSPHLAYDTRRTLEEARRLWHAVGRENLMIKVPGTPEGIAAVEQLISEGININVTLLFALDAYEAAAGAYLAGLERWIAGGGDPTRLASVASFFLSRIDSAVDERVARQLDATEDPERRAKFQSLDAKVAIACARLAHARFEEIFGSERWRALAAKGARPQRLLWASTGTKKPELPMTLYVDSLIGADTVNTLPRATFAAFKEQGVASDSLGERKEERRAEARETLAQLGELGISLEEITRQLLVKGCQLFCDAADQLLAAVESKRRGGRATKSRGGAAAALGGAEASAREALRFVEPGHTVGLGTGRAATAFVRALGARVAEGLEVTGVPTSEATAAVARELGISLVALDQVEQIDITFDGADEVDAHLDLIKGYGGALVREKVVAASSQRLVILVGSEKCVSQLGARGLLPVEVLPFAEVLCRRQLRALGCEPIRRESSPGVPYVTDNGNYVLDCKIAPIEDAEQLDRAILAIPGVLGTGLFLGMADAVIVQDGDRVEVRRRLGT